ncbi:MAG: response regulator transcription factor [Spirochaetales bacterium]|nr:response regulator transcription factor [Spirochaetales bacterium]
MIYVIEDNPQIREVVVEYLRLKDYEVREFAGVRGVVEAAVHMPPELCILDVLLPDGNGFALAKKLREQVPEVPFIFLTAKDTESDRILGLELGAEDYVVKPFSPRELILRVEAVLRRTGKRGAQGETLWEWENSVLQIDEPSHTLAVDGTGIKLTSAEWKILSYLASQPGVVVNRERILGDCLEYIYAGSERTIDTHIKNIRSKLGKDGWIETIRGFGYRFQGKRKR